MLKYEYESKFPSVLDLIEKNNKDANHNTKSPEIAATVKQQEMMANEGELIPVAFRGPNGTLIPGYYSNSEKAFLPKFEID